MANKFDYDEICADVFDTYKSVMNNLVIKTDIAHAIFNDKEWSGNGIVFIGSYMSYPPDEEKTKKLQAFYKDANTGESTVDAKPFKVVVKKLAKDIKQNLKNEYICFVLGAVEKANNVSHHIGFIYETHSHILKMFDPGQQSWGPGSARIVAAVTSAVFEKLKINFNGVSAYSGKWYCSQCVGPQDVCRGGILSEVRTAPDASVIPYNPIPVPNPLYNAHASLHRESFCQTWSLILILNEIQQIQELGGGHNFADPKLSEWSNAAKGDLEICIRRFILWIVYKYPGDFENTWMHQTGTKDKFKYRKLLLKCMRHFNPVLDVPQPGTSMCTDITLSTSAKHARKKRRK